MVTGQYDDPKIRSNCTTTTNKNVIAYPDEINYREHVEHGLLRLPPRRLPQQDQGGQGGTQDTACSQTEGHQTSGEAVGKETGKHVSTFGHDRIEIETVLSSRMTYEYGV